MKAHWSGWRNLAYAGLLASAFAVAVLGSWRYGSEVDNWAYDYMFRHYQPAPWQTQSVLLAIDEPTLQLSNGMRGIRGVLAEGLRRVAAAKPKAVAVDIILADPGDPAENAALADAFRLTPNLVLSCQLINNGAQWEDPLLQFRRWAAAVGHVHAEPDPDDSVTRAISLEKRAGYDRRWALSLEAFRLSRGAPILESPSDLRVGSTIIPAPRTSAGRLMRVRFVPLNMAPIPRVSLAALLHDASLARQFTGKVVFAGVTAQTEVDRIFTPYAYGAVTPGIEINANAFETMAQGRFITDAPVLWVLLFCAGITIAIGLAFFFLPGWRAYAGAAAILLVAHVTPYVFFTHERVFSFAATVSVAWLAAIIAAAYQHLVVRRNLRRAEADRGKYQQTLHFVTHEMRTPLSAIQGSSELISRYPLTEEKRKQIADIIHSESKRLARMIEVFLNVERLSAGQMELKRETMPVKDLVDVSVARALPLGDRKRIRISLEPIPGDLRITGDRELMEYACYNLLTNAIKYSPQHTEVRISCRKDNGYIRVSVRDQGIGMDQKEVKKIFQKFYRTRRAEESGEAGTGIGLSIVQQIVEQHGGEIEVMSQPGEGSCFTLVLPVAAHAAAPTAAEQY
ncbi:MAG TPA: CHASE2 domain-containing protein [Bryobacteraceae bacterium]|nr:CHASE2 domain-containing protein [Bryobacteraceae bacterium]